MIRKFFILLLFYIAPLTVFSQEGDLPTFMVECDTGFAAGINLKSAMLLDVKLVYPYKRFGFVIETGGLVSPDYSVFHLFLGPVFFVVDNLKWRIPLAIGMDLMNGKTAYFGVGSIVAVHRRLTNYLYVGLSVGIIYAFDNLYKELTGYRTEKVVVDDGTGNAVFVEKTVPIYENKHHYGNNFYFKPSLVIGLQF